MTYDMVPSTLTARSRGTWWQRLGSLLVALPAAWWATPLAAQQAGLPPEAQPSNMVLRWVGVVLTLVLIWFVLYKVVYPFFLRYYRDDFCKTVFWNLFLLYSLTWLLLASYLLLEFGFYYGWMRWLAVFLGAIWLISGLVLFLQRRPAA
jgi:hypothetical protein